MPTPVQNKLTASKPLFTFSLNFPTNESMSLFLDTSCDQRRTQKHDVFKKGQNRYWSRGLHIKQCITVIFLRYPYKQKNWFLQEKRKPKVQRVNSTFLLNGLLCPLQERLICFWFYNTQLETNLTLQVASLFIASYPESYSVHVPMNTMQKG